MESDPFFHENKANRLKKAEKIRVNKPANIISSMHYCIILGAPIILLIIGNGSLSLILIKENYRF